jgi:hypothetical protein
VRPAAIVRKADQVGRFEQAEIEAAEANAPAGRHRANELALADAGRPLEQDGTPRAVGGLEDSLPVVADGDLVTRSDRSARGAFGGFLHPIAADRWATRDSCMSSEPQTRADWSANG